MSNKNDVTFNDDTAWRKSSQSPYIDCVEINGSTPGYVGVRDSKLGSSSPVLVFNRHEMQAFLCAVKTSKVRATPA